VLRILGCFLSSDSCDIRCHLAEALVIIPPVPSGGLAGRPV